MTVILWVLAVMAPLSVLGLFVVSQLTLRRVSRECARQMLRADTAEHALLCAKRREGLTDAEVAYWARSAKSALENPMRVYYAREPLDYVSEPPKGDA